MNKIQLLAFRIVIQYLFLMCGQLLVLDTIENGREDLRKIVGETERFYEIAEKRNENKN